MGILSATTSLGRDSSQEDMVPNATRMYFLFKFQYTIDIQSPGIGVLADNYCHNYQISEVDGFDSSA